MFLENPEQGALYGQGEIGDFVEKDGSAVGLLEESFPAFLGVGECPLLVSEKNGLGQGVRQIGAVHDGEGLLSPVAVVVHGPGKELLAGSGFPEQQDVVLCAGHDAHPLDGAEQFRAGADDRTAMEC